MNFFKRKTISADDLATEELMRHYAKKDKRAARVSKGDMSQAQNALASLTSEFRHNAESQQMASKRMNTLMKTMSKMETRLEEFDRVETDNHKLSKELGETKQKVKQKTALLEELDKTLADLRRQRNSFKTELETTQTSLSQHKDQNKTSREILLKQSKDIEHLQSTLLNKEESVQTLSITNQNYKEDIEGLTANYTDEKHRRLELQKSSQEFSTRLADKTQAAETATLELKSLQARFTEQKEKLFKIKGEKESLTFNIASQKTNFEDSLKRREDELSTLKTQIEHLNTQVRIKDNMTEHFEEELTGLRAALDSERSRATRETNALKNKSAELEQNTRSLTKTKAEYEELQSKFTAAIEDMEVLRKLCAIQKQKLEKYAAITGGSSGEVFIHQDKSSTNADYKPHLKAI